MMVLTRLNGYNQTVKSSNTATSSAPSPAEVLRTKIFMHNAELAHQSTQYLGLKSCPTALRKSSISRTNYWAMKELTDFIQANPDPKELKRALAVQMVMQNYTHSQIVEILRVSLGFVNKWKHRFLEQGIAGLILRQKGSRGYLTSIQQQAIIDWLKQKNYCHLSELKQHVKSSFGVIFESNKSYYKLFKLADISWKKTQRTWENAPV